MLAYLQMRKRQIVRAGDLIRPLRLTRLQERESREALLESYAASAFIDSVDGARQRRVLLLSRRNCPLVDRGVRTKPSPSTR